eukprot:COSAG06_NODE_2295_length_7137_cov_9.154305_3_plen_278_part_00
MFACADPKGVFASMDTDGSGELDYAEFEQALHKLGLPMHKDEAAQLMAAMDADGSGTIDEQEFFAVVKIASEAEAEVLEKALENKRKGEDTRDAAAALANADAANSVKEGTSRGVGVGSGSTDATATAARSMPVPIVWVAEERSRSTAHGSLPLGCEEVPKHHTFPQALRFGMGDGADVTGQQASKAAGLVRRFVNVLSQKRNIGGVTQDRSAAGAGVYEVNPRAVFDSLDQDGSGELDADEFETALSMLGCGCGKRLFYVIFIPKHLFAKTGSGQK